MGNFRTEREQSELGRDQSEMERDGLEMGRFQLVMLAFTSEAERDASEMDRSIRSRSGAGGDGPVQSAMASDRPWIGPGG